MIINIINQINQKTKVLRQSLAESQKRCQAYNDNMLRVANSNDELAGTLNTVKNTNNRLVDQLARQSEEVDQLTQQRYRLCFSNACEFFCTVTV